MKRLPTLHLVLYGVILTIYSVFSYALTAPNLVLSSWAPYWQFQQYMWQTFFNNRPLLTYSYMAILAALFLSYYWLCQKLNQLNNQNWLSRKMLLIYLALLLPLFFANNALSYDAFNYIFNAKMVLIYHSNPHVKTALDFAYDNWTRFMHNTHTPAPYGYGWTLISLAPYLAGLNKFLPTLYAFKAFSLISLIGSIGTVWWIYQKLERPQTSIWFAWIFLNPLILLEIVTNVHNDLWMLWPALLSFGLLIAKKNQISWGKILFSAILLTFSISIKLATAALIPIWAALIVVKIWPATVPKMLATIINQVWPLLASLTLFLPLLTQRSKQFLPWYLIWSLIWLPLIPQKIKVLDQKIPFQGLLQYMLAIWPQLILWSSFFALWRYIPFLYTGNFEASVELQQKLIVWIPIILADLVLTIRYAVHSKQ